MSYQKVKEKFIRLKNDINGNPRYFITKDELARICGVSVELLDEFIVNIGWRKSRNSEYPDGYIRVSYNLLIDCEYITRHLKKIQKLREEFPTVEIRFKYGVQQKINNRWQSVKYLDNLFKDLDFSLNLDWQIKNND